VYLKDLFRDFSIESMQETMLGTNEWKEDSQRLVWGDHHDDRPANNETVQADLFVTLNQQQIRTFIISVLAEN